MTTYLALVHTDAPNNYGVSFPDLPGCISVGDTLDEAIENAGEALAFHVEGMREDGEALPDPRSVHDLRDETDVRELMDDAIIVAIPLRESVAA